MRYLKAFMRFKDMYQVILKTTIIALVISFLLPLDTNSFALKETEGKGITKEPNAYEKVLGDLMNREVIVRTKNELKIQGKLTEADSVQVTITSKTGEKTKVKIDDITKINKQKEGKKVGEGVFKGILLSFGVAYVVLGILISMGD